MVAEEPRFKVIPPPREHFLLCPDTYIGSIKKRKQTLWVWEEDKMVRRSISYVPGLYKIFDEILVNAADNKQRDPKMDSIKVKIDVEENLISVYNNGDGIPVVVHKKRGVYVPELLFGLLLTSTNHDDSIKKTTGGRYGYGAKLANIFSTEFTIETADGKLQYKQVFSNNMEKVSKPTITECNSGENWTRVSFRPDLSTFGMTCLEADVVALMKRRVVDLAGCLGKSVEVELDGKHVPLTTFEDYAKLYLPSSQEPLRIYEKVNERWEVCVSMADGHFEQVSFVNNIATIKGGSHLVYITNQIAKHLVAVVRKQDNHANLKARDVNKYLWFFVNAYIDNPEFDSQRKETLTIKQSSFGSKCVLTPDFLQRVVTSDIVKKVISDLKKADVNERGKLNIPGLKEANFAATNNSVYCTLILAVGDSAKDLAMSGLTVVGQDYYGVFPLKVKLLNLREATPKQLQGNVEIQKIMKVLGLQHGKEHNNVPLRYGHLMIMADQDQDGSHIKELLTSYWPFLLKVPEFLLEFITPIAKATDNKTNNVLNFFYTFREYKEWKGTVGDKAQEINIKFYDEGLGTSNGKARAEYFADLDKHKRDFVWADDMNKLFISADDEDGDAIELAFSKKKIEARKTWLRALQAGTYFDSKEKHIPYCDFINKELILSSMADFQSIPSMVDGLKPSQRKVLFCAFKKPIIQEEIVIRFSCYVRENTAYQYGDAIHVASTIIGMAQNFVGSNNINLLYPKGQFGTRCMGGKDHARSSCIYTKLTPIARHLFHKADELVLNYRKDKHKKYRKEDKHKKSIEPAWYLPIIPMVLVNGSEGIGTRWNTFVPNYNPRDIIANVRRLLNDEAMVPMDPWYRGFKGTIEKSSSMDTYISTGIVEEVDQLSLRITELPVGRWIEEYREFLEAASLSGKDKEPFIEDYNNYSGIDTVLFEVKMTADQMNKAKQEGLLKKFKLTTNLNTSNMYLLDASGDIKKYETPEQILEDFFRLRLDYYEKRKSALLSELETAILILENKEKFNEEFADESSLLPLLSKLGSDLCAELEKKGYKKLPEEAVLDASVAGAVDKGSKEMGYDYLLSGPLKASPDEKRKLVEELKLKKAELDKLKAVSSRTLWLEDLDALGKQLDELDEKAMKWKRPEKARVDGPGSPAVKRRGKAFVTQEEGGDDDIVVQKNRIFGLHTESSPDQFEGKLK